MYEELIEKRDAWWVPKIDRECFQVILQQVDDIYEIIEYCDSRDTVIQAGGNLGIWPIAMTAIFKKVITAEPDPVNFACLSKNIEVTLLKDNLTALNVGFGESHKLAKMHHLQPTNVGAHHLAEYDQEGESVTVIPIDSLRAKNVSLIQLDIEGYEHLALKGAKKTIDKWSPTIVLEMKGCGKRVIDVTDDETKEMLKEWGYEPVAKIHRDIIFRRKQKI